MARSTPKTQDCFDKAIGLTDDEAAALGKIADAKGFKTTNITNDYYRATATMIGESQATRADVIEALADLDPESAKAYLPQPVMEVPAAVPLVKPPSARELARVQREAEVDTFNSLVSSPDMIGKSVEAITAMLTEKLTSSKPEAIEKMAKELQKAVLKNQAEIEKAKNRDPEKLKAAINQSMPNTVELDHAPIYSQGFQHALAGKSKSTLSGENLTTMQLGYEAGRAWIKTDEGKAFYEGTPVAKLENTGMDLRRHWDLMKAQMKANESDIEKAWKAIERATNRGDLFTPLLPDGVKPGFKLYVTEIRDNLLPFKKWLDKRVRWYGNESYRSRYSKSKSDTEYMLEGSRYPGELSDEDRKKFKDDPVYRADYLRMKAEEYLTNVKSYLSFLDGNTTVADASAKFSANFIEAGTDSPQEDGRVLAWKIQTTDAGTKAVASVFDGYSSEFVKYRASSAWTQALIEKQDSTDILPNRAKALTPPKLDRVTRESLPDYREGKDITPAEFKAKFGFSDVGFGTWVGAKQDQDHLNYAYDAMMDLSKHFGAPANAVGLGIHFTIGALGHGKFSAHFQAAHPSPIGPVQVINLTNTRGDGTVYHEWTHALDYNMGGEWKNPPSSSGITVRSMLLNILKHKAVTVDSLNYQAKRFLVGGTYWKGDKRGDKVQAAIYGIRRFQSSMTAYKTNADALGEDYWGNNEELIARGAEAWAVDTLGGEHSYLVNKAWAGDGAVTPAKGFRGTPYPMGEERVRFNKAFAALAKATKWVDGNPTVTVADFKAAFTDETEVEAMKRREYLLTEEGMKAYHQELLDAETIKQDERNAVLEKQFQEQREKKEEEQRLAAEVADRLAAEKLAELEALDAPKPNQTQGALTDDDLNALFDQAAAEVREENQEKPEEPTPGEASTVEVPALSDWSAEDLQEVLNKSPNPDMIVTAGGVGIPGLLTIHDMGNLGKTDFIGFGFFETTGTDADGKAWKISWSGGGAMSRTAGGKAYTTVDVSGPGKAPFNANTRELIEAALKNVTPKAKPDAPAAVPTEREPKEIAPQESALVKQSASALIADAAKLGVKGIDEALTGLAKLFGSAPGRLNSFPAGFDKETYEAAKPHFEKSLASFQEAGKSLMDLFKMLIQHFGDGVKMYAVQFAKEKNLTNNLGQQDAAQGSPSSKVAQWVQEKLASGAEFKGQELFDYADTVFGGTQAEGKYTPKDAYDAMEMGINRYILANPTAFNPNNDGEVLSTVARLQRLTQLLATQTKRTAETDEFQQFSTVPAFSFVANWVSGVGPGDVMLEPSGGIGGLAIFARNAGAELVLNELSSRRADILQEVFPTARVFRENAEQINNILPDDVKPTRVVMNPPFSASAGRLQGERNTMLGAKHVEQALLRLEDGGRLVAIVGEGMTMDKPTFKKWWKEIGAKYNVRAVIPVDGKGYAKYGTTFSNALLVIDKVKPTGNDVVTTPASTYEDLVGILKGIRNDQPTSTPRLDTSVERDLAESERKDAIPAGEGTDGVINDSGEPAVLGGNEPDGSGRNVAGRGGRGRSPGAAKKPGKAVPESGGTGDGEGANPEGSGDDLFAASGGSDTAGEQSGLQIGGAEAASGELTDSIFENYQPQRLQIPGALPHPGPLVQSAAMASVLPPAATYTPNLPRETITEGKLSLPQLESVVYAGQAHQEELEDKVDKAAADKYQLKEGQHYRKGYFIGDGTGVGKGREIGGIILDNLRQGRKKAIWISEKTGLLESAKRDFSGVGGNPALLFGLSETKASDAKVSKGDGIMFTTYTTLKMGNASNSAGTGKPATPGQLEKAFPSGTDVVFKNGLTGKVKSWNKDGAQVNLDDGRSGLARLFQIDTLNGKNVNFDDGDAIRAMSDKKAKKNENAISRIQQVVDWVGADFDGVLAFDESHNAGNAISIKGERGTSKPSQQALSMIELQRRLPRARIVYVSATGATTVENLAYANRLGLWGTGTAFPDVKNFVSEMMAGGLATMELVARDMKQMGVYMARSLSFDGVTYGRIDHELSPIQTDAYNKMAEAWQLTLAKMDEAMEKTGVTEMVNGRPVTRNSDAKKNVKAAYWGAQLRFFNQVITSMQMPSVLEQMEKDVAAGHALVLQLVNTNEAALDRAVEDQKDEDEQDLADIDLTPQAMLVDMIRKVYPVVQMQEVIDENGNKKSEPVKDASGNLVENKEAVAARDALMAEIAAIRNVFPDAPLDMVIKHFGVDTVAEVTGRGKRIVNKPSKEGGMELVLETRGAHANAADANSFMDDKKRILIFSNAGGTGYSFHADLTKTNQRKRAHYLIQPGWRADKAVQGFGRSHRTNQKSAPHYWLAATNIPAHKRFLSAIARRLDMLGAMTKGQRDTANQGLFSEKDNLDSKYAQQAVTQLVNDAQRGQLKGLSFTDFMTQTGLSDAVDPNTGMIADNKMPKTSQFLNRMLSMPLHIQEMVFEAFIARMEEKIDIAIQRNELDAGMETLKAISTKVVAEDVAYVDPKSGAETKLVNLELKLANTMYPFPQEKTQGAAIEWFTNKKSGRVWGAVLSGSVTLRNGAVVDRYRMLGTGGTQITDSTKLKPSSGQSNFQAIEDDQARAMWDTETAARPATITKNTHMIVGALLPIWDRLKTNDSTMRVMRTQTEDNRRLLGRIIPEGDITDVRARLNVASPESKLAPVDVMKRIMKGEKAELANGWTLERATVAQDLRIEIKGVPYYSVNGAAGNELVASGVIKERINYNERLFVPTGAAGIPVLETLLKTKPVVKLTDPNVKEEGPAVAADDPNVAFARSGSVQKGMPVNQVSSIVSAIKTRWANAPEIIVAASMDDSVIPENVRAYNDKQKMLGAKGEPMGFVHGGTVYVIANQLTTPGHVVEALFHETLGHIGLRGAFGPTLNQVLNQIVVGRKAEVESKARKYGLDVTNKADMLQAAEEVLAELAQTHPEIGFVKRAIAAIRTWLRDNIPQLQSIKLSDAEIIRNFILPARNFIEKGQGAAVDGSAAMAMTAGNWYSELLKQVMANKQDTMPAAQWASWINSLTNKGVKPAEIEWSGVQDWLKLQTGKVTKAQVADYLDGNLVQVSETQYSNDGGEAKYRAHLAEMSDEELQNQADMNDVDSTHLTRDEAIDAIIRGYQEDMAFGLGQEEDGTKYAKYVLPGGQNYREVLLTLPTKREWLDGSPVTAEDLSTQHGRDAADRVAIHSDATYQSNHWRETPNVLAHIRVNDRTDADGARVLMVEEIQSDFAQDYRKSKDAISKAVDDDFIGIVERMKKAGVLEVNCD